MAEIPECIGPYRVLSVVGEGGMGVVYKAEDPRLERVVALKVIREFDGDDTRRRRFWQEARAAAQVTYPNACRIYDITEERGRLVLVMEFIDGESLAKRLERGFLPAQEAGQVALSVLSALEAFHKIGIVHRDLKPSNIVLANGGTKLLDFGIAKHVALNANEEAAATLGHAADGWNRDEGASTPITTDHRAAVPDVAAKRRHPVSGVQLAGGNNGLSCWTGKPGGALVDCGGAVFRACA